MQSNSNIAHVTLISSWCHWKISKRFSTVLIIVTSQTNIFAVVEYLAKKEVKIQERENKIRARRDARIAAEKEAANKSKFVFWLHVVPGLVIKYSLMAFLIVWDGRQIRLHYGSVQWYPLCTCSLPIYSSLCVLQMQVMCRYFAYRPNGEFAMKSSLTIPPILSTGLPWTCPEFITWFFTALESYQFVHGSWKTNAVISNYEHWVVRSWKSLSVQLKGAFARHVVDCCNYVKIFLSIGS